MARKKKDEVKEQVKEQIQEVVNEQIQDNKQENNKEQNCVHNKEIIIPDIVIRDTRTLEQKLNSYKRKLRRI